MVRHCFLFSFYFQTDFNGSATALTDLNRVLPSFSSFFLSMTIKGAHRIRHVLWSVGFVFSTSVLRFSRSFSFFFSFFPTIFLFAFRRPVPEMSRCCRSLPPDFYCIFLLLFTCSLFFSVLLHPPVIDSIKKKEIQWYFGSSIVILVDPIKQCPRIVQMDKN